MLFIVSYLLKSVSFSVSSACRVSYLIPVLGKAGTSRASDRCRVSIIRNEILGAIILSNNLRSRLKDSVFVGQSLGTCELEDCAFIILSNILDILND